MSFLLRLLLRRICAGVCSMHAKLINQCLMTIVTENRYYLQTTIEETHRSASGQGLIDMLTAEGPSGWFMRLAVHSFCFGFRYLIHCSRATKAKQASRGTMHSLGLNSHRNPWCQYRVMPTSQHLQHSRQDSQALIQGLACVGLQFPIPHKVVPNKTPLKNPNYKLCF